MTNDLLKVRRFDPDDGPSISSFRCRERMFRYFESTGYEIGLIMIYTFWGILAHICYLLCLWGCTTKWGKAETWTCEYEVTLVSLIYGGIIFFSIWEDRNNYVHAQGFPNLFNPDPHSARILVDLCIAVAFQENPTDYTIFCKSSKESTFMQFLRSLKHSRDTAGTWIQLPGIVLTSIAMISLFRLVCNLVVGLYILVTNWYTERSQSQE